MSKKHYNASYLEDTANFLKGLKEYSYQPFSQITCGTIIDLGCGTGIDVLNMSQFLGDNVNVIGVDHDEALLSKGRHAAAGKNVHFVQSEAHQIPFEDDSIDGLRTERLIQHLTEPEAVVAEVKRVLKPNGSFLIVETDWASLVFYHGNILVQEKVVHYLTRKKINNGFAARKLTQYLEQSAFRDIGIEIFPFTLRSLREANDYLWIEIILSEMLEKEVLSSEEYGAFLEDLKIAEEMGYFACTINIVVVSSIK